VLIIYQTQQVLSEKSEFKADILIYIKCFNKTSQCSRFLQLYICIREKVLQTW